MKLEAYYSVLFVLISSTLSAQSIGKSGITTASLHYKSSQIHHASIGETVIGNHTNAQTRMLVGYLPMSSLTSLNTEIPDLAPQIIFYPNPARHSIYLDSTTIDRINVTISSLSGKLIFQSVQQTDTPIDIQLLPTGVYLLQLTDTVSGASNSYKLIIQ